MSYATASITSATPAKDLMAALNTPLTGGGLSFVESFAAPGTGWQAVAYGGGTFVTVAYGTSTAATSTDGITWTQRSLPVATGWQAVTYGNGLFVAVSSSGSGIAATSPDGITWTQRVLPTAAAWSTVAYGGGVYVTIAQATSIAASSPDGITWTQRAMPSSVAWYSVAYGNSRFVATTLNNSYTATSPDGITWTLRSLAFNTAVVAFGAGLFVINNYGLAFMYTSPDGVTWTQRSIPVSSAAQSITYGNGLFVSPIPGTPTVLSSPDGITWTVRTLSHQTNWIAVAAGGGTFVAVSNNNTSASVSSDAITWTARPLSGTTQSAAVDVYKSPAASNQFGSDWYLILRRVGDTGAALFYQVAENYDPATHLASGYGGLAAPAFPAAGTGGANPGVPSTPDTICATNANLSLTTIAFSYWVSVTANRVVIAVKTTVEQGFYAGLYDDKLPAGTVVFPLVCARIPTLTTAAQAMGTGGSSGGVAGGFTREPVPALVQTANAFDAVIHNGYSYPTNYASTNYTPMTSAAALYGNPCTMSRAMIGSGRIQGTPGDVLRGLLIGVMCSAVSSVAGDTTTNGGKTYTRFAGPATTFGFFVDQAL